MFRENLLEHDPYLGAAVRLVVALCCAPMSIPGEIFTEPLGGAPDAKIRMQRAFIIAFYISR